MEPELTLTMQIEIKREYWPNGQISSERELLNSVRHGKQIGWFDNGRLCYLYFRKNGSVDGMYQNWLDDGTRHMIDCDKNNQRHGIQIWFKYK